MGESIGLKKVLFNLKIYGSEGVAEFNFVLSCSLLSNRVLTTVLHSLDATFILTIIMHCIIYLFINQHPHPNIESN